MKRAFFFSAVFFNATFYGQDSLDARAILEKVREASRSGRSYRTEFNAVIENHSSELQQKVALSGIVIFQPPDKLRAEIATGPLGVLMISDGTMSWTYVPATKRYAQSASTAPMPGNPGDLSVLLGNVNGDLRSVRRETDQEVVFEDGRVRCYVIAIESNHRTGERDANFATITSTIWVDQTNYAILRGRTVLNTGASQPQAVTSTVEFSLTKLTWSPPLTGDEFTFVPPQGAIEIARATAAAQHENGGQSGERASNRATVMSESLPMYSKMSTASAVVELLHKNEVVNINFSIGGSDGAWCAITQSAPEAKSGNVRCDSLKREPLERVPERADRTTQFAPTSGAIRAAPFLPAARVARIPAAPRNTRVYLIPLGDLASIDMVSLVAYYQQRLGLRIQPLPAIPLDPRAFNRARRQYAAQELIALLKRRLPVLANDSRAILIGVTESDMYSSDVENWRFALGWRNEGRFAVVSSARMDTGHIEFGRPPDSNALHRNFAKMLSREIGFLHYGLPFSSNPRSVLRASIMGTDELDELGEDF